MNDAPEPSPSSDASLIVDQRLTALEIKASFADDLLEELNRIVIRQQQQIDLLMREVAWLRRQQPEGGTSSETLRDQLPPHY